MRSISGFLTGRSPNASSQSLTLLDEDTALEDASFAVKYILNDDMDKAQELLAKDDTPFHKLGKAVAVFLQAALGFEKDKMKEASELLHAAGSAASQYRNSPQKCGHRSKIYPPGIEFALIHAETQLMAAVVAILNENLTEALKGFYNIRKAYQTLQTIAEAEKKFLANKAASTVTSPVDSTEPSRRPSADLKGSAAASAPVPNSSAKAQDANHAEDSDDDSELEFVDAEEGDDDAKPVEAYNGHIDSPTQKRLERLSTSSTVRTTTPANIISPEDLSGIVDRFTHSGVALCMGILQLLLSLIPPAFGRLLSIVGFRGDRDNGLALLWSAAEHLDQIHGALASLVILGYHTNMGNFCEIIGHDSHPRARCRALLTRLRELYPTGGFWLLDEARMVSGEGKPDDALKVLEGDDKRAKLKQIEAFRWFEMSMNWMCIGEWEKCSEGFIKTADLNGWSPSLYNYFAAICHVELYHIHSDPHASDDAEKSEMLAAKHKSRGTELLMQVKAKNGKKRLLARQLPFDMYIGKKMTKWESIAERRGCDLLDAIGVSPMQEMIFLWTGHKRMRRPHIEYSLERVEAFPARAARSNGVEEFKGVDDTAWEAGVAQDELLTYHLQRAVILQRLGRTSEARAVLESRLLTVSPAEFKAAIGTHGDNWILPTAYYELAVTQWGEYLALSRAADGTDDLLALGAADREKAQGLLKQCAANVDKVAKWESYDLDSRFGIKVRAAQETLKKRGIS